MCYIHYMVGLQIKHYACIKQTAFISARSTRLHDVFQTDDGISTSASARSLNESTESTVMTTHRDHLTYKPGHWTRKEGYD